MVYLSAFLPRILSRKIRNREKSPGLKLPFVIGWAGMRGVVSLASALAIPLTLENGEAFPHRNLILFITFVVILVTLVFQGLTLPLFLKVLKIDEVDDLLPYEEQIEAIRLQIAKESVQYLDEHYAKEMDQYETIARIKIQLIRSINATENAAKNDTRAMLDSVRKLYAKIMLELIDFRRKELIKISQKKIYEDSVIRDMEYNLDLEESRLNRQ